MLLNIKLFINRLLHLFEVRKFKKKGNGIYLTFDDGPEPGITEFVLEELNKYNFKATFFCRGDNAESNQALLQRIVMEGHALGNHTYSHANGLYTSTDEYISNVDHADSILHSHLFRPPFGCLTLISFLKLYRRYKIVYWSIISGDADTKNFDKSKALLRLQNNTTNGDVVLFHFCHQHENETRQLLPEYLLWLSKNNYRSFKLE